MLMIQMTGGMGNQMFYYALYKALQAEGKDVCMEDFTHYAEIGRTDNRLESIFPLTYKRATKKEYDRLTDSSMLPWKRVRRKLLGRKGKVYKEKDAFTFEEALFSLEDAYCVGYWQSERYFEKVKALLYKDFSFDWNSFPAKALEYRKRMQDTMAVSVHVRRGDYLNEKFKGLYGGICTEAYYEGAMAYMRKTLEKCTFFLFTNDRKWGEAQTKADVVYVDCAEADTAYLDMALMSCCKHHILANSSFSYWGAWLNQSPDRIVVTPSIWLNGSKGQDIYAGLDAVKIDAKGNVEL